MSGSDRNQEQLLGWGWVTQGQRAIANVPQTRLCFTWGNPKTALAPQLRKTTN